MYVCLEREKQSFAIKTCAVAAGKNLVDLIEFNPVQQASYSRLEKKKKNCILMIKSGLMTLRELTRV